MRESTLRLLVHPETLEPFHVSVTKRDADDVCEGTLHAGRGTQYPILNGIPTFVPAEVASSQTVRSFSDKWSKHKYYREHTRRFYAEWYFSRYGFDGSNGLGQFLEGMDFILDAGTGAGRDAALLADASSATVFGVDSARSALEAARKQVNDARVAFVQADLNGLPFPDEFFDFINCDQVIHHMPEPQATFERLRAKLKPGGWICCYVYRKKAVVREFTDDYIRTRISELPIDDALRVCEGITHLGRQLAELKVTVNVEHDIPILGIARGKIDLQRFFHWNLFKCFWNDEFDFFTNNIINFDWYHPEHCHRFEPDEFRAWFSDGWSIQAWDVQDAGISCRAQKL